MPVPNQFANVTTSIPLSQLDANFNTPITLGNTAIQLGNTVTTLNNMTLANVTVTSGNVTITNVSVTTANVTTANIATAQIANVTVSGTSTFAAGSNTAPSITFTGDTNTGIYSPAADTVAIATGGTAAVTVSSSQNVGIGGTPAQRLDVFGVTSDATPVALLRAYTTGSDGARTVPVRFVSSNNNNWANAQYEAYNHNFNGNGTLVFLVKQEGVVVLKGGNTSATGTGIAFPATQSASSDANTLDDYEEGTFTATLSPGTSGSITLNSIYDLLSYTKIGRLVTITGQLVVSSVSSPVGSLVNLNNLPFPCADTGELSERAGGCTTYVDNSANAYYTQGMLLAAGDTFTRILMSEAGRVAAIAVDDGFVFSFSYIAAT